MGGSVREPIADRYVVWFGTQRLGYSTTLNKYDRITGLTTTLTFDPVEGAYPKGKLLDLGNGTALGFIEKTKPTTREGKYGYGGGPGTRGVRPGILRARPRDGGDPGLDPLRPRQDHLPRELRAGV